MISVEEALGRITAALTPVGAEQVSLADGIGRILAEDVVARIDKPPAPVSAMDGYAVRAADVASVPAILTQTGYVPAGQSFEGTVGPGEAVRIFTGAPVADGADTIVIQEHTEADGNRITVAMTTPAGKHIRVAGLDFKTGETGLAAGRRLGARDIGLAGAMNLPWLKLRRKPRIAVLATGDEVVMPGDPIGRDQIVSSNSVALGAFIAARGGIAVDLGIAPDDRGALAAMAAGARGADLLVTTGGASVGDHDLIRSVLGEQGLKIDFWRIAMRPGKPLIFGRIGETAMLGLPGNPVSSLVCALLFLGPAIDALLGLGAPPKPPQTALLGRDLKANDGRQDYLRAKVTYDSNGARIATPFEVQDSSMLSSLSAAGCLVVRPPNAAAAKIGDPVPVIAFDGEAFGF